MARCTHLAWLDVDDSAPHFSIVDGHRLDHVAAELPRPALQSPCIILYLGARQKLRALQALYRGNNFSRRATHGLANLHVESYSLQQDQPTLIADCHVKANFSLAHGSYNGCHETERYAVRMDHDISPVQLRNQMLAKLILPFCHVVCVFAADLGGNKACSSYLRLLISATDDTHIATNLIVVVSNQEQVEDLIRLECEPGFTQNFESFAVVQSGQLDAIASLRFKVESSMRNAKLQSVQNSVNLSALHLARTFGHAVADFCAVPAKKASLFTAYRHPLLEQDLSLLPINISKVLSHPNVVKSQVYDHIASCMLVQAFPADHHAFDTDLLTQSGIGPALSKVLDTLEAQGIVASFQTLSRRFKAGAAPKAIRLQLLRQHRQALSTVTTFQVCLMCFFRPGEITIGCVHAICEPCACEYFEYDKLRHIVTINTCYVCGQSTTHSLRLKPPTSAPSILAIDGGGVRGIVSLELLARLQSALAAEDVTDWFDLVVGTSVGGLIVLHLVVRGSTITASIASFIEFATRVFAGNKRPWRSPCSRLLSILIWLFCDSKYDATVMKEVTEEIFGKQSILFQQKTGCRATKVGIMATTIDKSDLRIFTNYNGLGRGNAKLNYGLLRPDSSAEEPTTAMVAQATTAAPGYFPPLVTTTFGALQDGGLRANNPTEAALPEARCIWPQCADPSIVLSVGTGYEKSPTHPLHSARSFWFNTFMPRIFRAFMASPCLHGQNSWLALMTRLGSRQKNKFLRLNMEFDKQEPALDDIHAIPRLQVLAMDAPVDIVPFRDQIWASAFYFELTQQPSFYNGMYHCKGMLRCRFSDSRRLLSVILNHYPDTKIVVDRDIYCELQASCCSGCGIFVQELTFTTKRLTDMINMELIYERGNAHHVSGFPNGMRWFLDTQANGTVGWPQKVCCSEVSRKRKASPQFLEGKRIKIAKTSTKHGYWMHK